MRLFYHFEHSTSKTLAIAHTNIWTDSIPIALDHDYLMHAILAMAASHLRHSGIQAAQYAEAELLHQSAAIAGLREALAGPITSVNSDALFTCAMLIYHHAWTAIDEGDLELIINFPSGLHDIVPLAMGVKGLVSETILKLGESMWLETMAYSPRIALLLCTEGTAEPERLEKLFRRQFHLIETGNSTEDGWRFEAFMVECRRLIPVVAVLNLIDGGASNWDAVLHSVIRYLFTWPVLLREGFADLVPQHDCLALVVLYHFFTAVEKVPAHHMWWSRRRARFVMSRLTASFEASGVEVVDLYAPADGKEMDQSLGGSYD
jgi:hypothetical protein